MLGFVLFAETALLRRVSGRLAEAGPTQRRLAAVSPLVSALGLAGLALNADALPALLWVLLMGVGFALPYAVVIERAQRLFPESAAEVMAVRAGGAGGLLAVAALLNAGRGATGSRSAGRPDTRTAAPSATT